MAKKSNYNKNKLLMQFKKRYGFLPTDMKEKERCTLMILSFILFNYKRNGIKVSKIITVKRFKREKFTKDNIFSALDDLKRISFIYEPKHNIIKLQPWMFDLKEDLGTWQI